MNKFLEQKSDGVGVACRLTVAKLICVFCGLIYLPWAIAQSVGEVHFPKSKTHLLLTYDVRHEMVQEFDSTPLLRIYGDGHVLVRRRAYMKSSGDFEMQLSDEEVQQLCRKLISRQLMAYQSGAAQKEIERKLTEESRDFAVSDSSESKIQFFPHAIRLANSARIEPVGSRSHRFRDVSTYARFFPGNRAAVNMMEVEKMLWSMVNSSSLSRITQ